MSVALAHQWWTSPEEYLAGEELAETRHEYVGGIVYAMAGAKNRHNQIATNILGELYAALRDRACQPFNSDAKVRVRHGSNVRFYYPDAMVVCEPNSLEETFQDRPVVIFEVLSESTERTDREEKLRAYQSTPSLCAYVVVESERLGLTCHHRPDPDTPWTVERIEGRGDVLSLPAIGCALPLVAIYARCGL